MGAPIITDSDREWAAALVNAVCISDHARGMPVNHDRIEQRIRDAWHTPRYHRAEDIDPDTDHGYTNAELDRMADAEAAREWWARQGGDAA